jgi:O-antigen/teichoic acid export membrane protein
MAAAWTTLASYDLAFLLALALSHRSYPLAWEWAKIGRVIALMVGLFLLATGLGLEDFWLKMAMKLAALLLFGAILTYWNYGDIVKDMHRVRLFGHRGVKRAPESQG